MLDRLFNWFYWRQHPEQVAELQSLVNECRQAEAKWQREFVRVLRETIEAKP